MQRQIILTTDGSHTISIPEMNVTYHSVHGAMQESMHVFINAGFIYRTGNSNQPGQLSILEIGFGTGLNALLTAIEAEKKGKSIYYAALEPYPLNDDEILSLNYCELLGRKDLQEDFIKMHHCEWNRSIVVTENLLMHKSNSTLQVFEHKTRFDLIYFDAFAPATQPELWTVEVFKKIYDLLQEEGILVTYCSKGDVRRAMQSAGFKVEKIPGPPGKREMLRAIRNQ